jgi:hypothetical protein
VSETRLYARRERGPKRKAVELPDPAAPPQSKLVVEFVRARPTEVQETGTNEHTAN